MISVAQVVAAMAMGAMLPITALLAAEVYRLRRARRPEAAPAEPPLLDGEAFDPVEAVAQLAAARFESFGPGPGDVRAADRSAKIIMLRRRADPTAKKRSPGSSPALPGRRPAGQRPEGAKPGYRPLR